MEGWAICLIQICSNEDVLSESTGSSSRLRQVGDTLCVSDQLTLCSLGSSYKKNQGKARKTYGKRMETNYGQAHG